MPMFFLRLVSFLLSLMMTLGLYIPNDFNLENVPSVADNSVRVISYNLRCENDPEGFVQGRSRLIIQILRKYRPDSFGVQECTYEWLRLLKLNLSGDYGVVYKMRDSDSHSECNAVFYLKDKYNLKDSGTIWLSKTPDKEGSVYPGADLPRIATWAVLENKQTGSTYAHINTHLHHMDEPTRIGQSEVLLSQINKLRDSGIPVVCSGDFNTSEDSLSYKLIASALKDTRYSAVNTEDGGTYNGYGKKYFDKPIDFIFVPSESEVINYKIINDTYYGLYPSDHFGLCSDFIL